MQFFCSGILLLAASSSAFTAAPLPKAAFITRLQPGAAWVASQPRVCQLCGGTMSELVASSSGADGSAFKWTPWIVVKVSTLFLLTGLAEIGGGWMVWQAVRAGKPWWWALVGSAVLVVYGFLPTLQPLSDFGRLYAVYGGIFIALSYAWGIRFDGMRIDRGDVVGSLMALVGVCIALFWPRSS